VLVSGFPALACSMGHEIKKDSLLAVSIFLIVFFFGELFFNCLVLWNHEFADCTTRIKKRIENKIVIALEKVPKMGRREGV
jgi:hypothetical protein